MSALRGLQQAFQSYLLHGDRAITGDIAATRGLDADVRLAIYADAYFLRLLEVLQKDFPALAAVAGEDQFAALCREYVRAHPSRHFSVRHLGSDLSAFLRAAAADRLWYAELAAFEWALGAAFDAADSATASIADAAAVPPENWGEMQFIPHPSLQRLDLMWNAPALWRALSTEQTQPEPQAAPDPQAWILWRRDLQTYFRALGPDETFALDAVRAGENFAQLCGGLTEWVAPSQVAAHAAGFLKTWLSEGLIARIE